VGSQRLYRSAQDRTERNKTKYYSCLSRGNENRFLEVQGQNRDISAFMDPVEVADKIVNAVLVSDKMLVTDITINRKK
jgi:hypothetical protein